MEASDMGVRLCQSVAKQMYLCLALPALPLFVFCLASFEIRPWLATLTLWWTKPWLDRTILFVLSRAAFGQATSLRDLLRARRHVWFDQFFRTLTWRRLSPWRSFTQPVYQLEGQSGATRRRRVSQIRSGHSGTALLATLGFMTIELFLIGAIFGLVQMIAPPGYEPKVFALFDGTAKEGLRFAVPFTYALVIFLLEPFYVAIGFALYLNRRVELEAWDIEQEFRRAFAR
jgi:hypothetical protein